MLVVDTFAAEADHSSRARERARTMAAVAAFIGIFAARILLDNIEEIILRERETIAHCVRNFRVPRGPRLDLDSCLRDVADANRMLADLAREEGWRFRHRCSLVYRPGAGQETFFRALRVGPRLAALVGSVVVDVEEVDARGDPEPQIDDDEASSSPAADDEGFEHVAACRRATLAEFYTMIQPALRQIAVDRVPMRASLSAPPVAPPVQSTASSRTTRTCAPSVSTAPWRWSRDADTAIARSATSGGSPSRASVRCAASDSGRSFAGGTTEATRWWAPETSPGTGTGTGTGTGRVSTRSGFEGGWKRFRPSKIPGRVGRGWRI